MDLDTIFGVDIWPDATVPIIAIVAALFFIRVGQHLYHKRRAAIEQKRVDKTKPTVYPW